MITIKELIQSARSAQAIRDEIYGDDDLSESLRKLCNSRADDCLRQALKLVESQQ